MYFARDLIRTRLSGEYCGLSVELTVTTTEWRACALSSSQSDRTSKPDIGPRVSSKTNIILQTQISHRMRASISCRYCLVNRQIDTYILMCQLLGIEASPHNGSITRVANLLKTPVPKMTLTRDVSATNGQTRCVGVSQLILLMCIFLKLVTVT